MESLRLKKVESRYVQELSQLFVTELKDPLLKRITITAVNISPDLRKARIYFKNHDESLSIKSVLKGLNRCRGHLKKELSHLVPLKYSPDLEFIEDHKAEELDRLESLFQQIEKKPSN